jgi:nucleotide-binding universal stress UspA family protein
LPQHGSAGSFGEISSMKKILLAIDGINIDMPALDFACYISRLTHSKLTGVFLENLVAEERAVIKSMQGVKYIDWEIDKDSDEYQQKKELIEKNILAFKEACSNRSVNYHLHRDRGVPAKEMIHESRYADLLIIDAATSFNKRYEGTPTGFVKDILSESECPVIIAPESFETLDEIVFAYDDSKSAMFAIRQFTYMFPELIGKKLTLVQVSESGEWNNENKHPLKEWLQNHYADFVFETLVGDPDTRLFDYLFKKKNIMVVMGSYGRNTASRFFKHSRADLLIKTVTQPIFISHL